MLTIATWFIARLGWVLGVWNSPLPLKGEAMGVIMVFDISAIVIMTAITIRVVGVKKGWWE
jgi:hypothetical protein